MRLLITGAAGMLGSDVRAAAAAAGDEVVACSRDELDVADPAAVTRALAQHAPDAVINCAAFTRVDDAELEIDAAVRVNTLGPAVLAAAVARAGAWLVHVSTDYVFDGTKAAPYVESDPPAPRSVYGFSKLAGESAVRQLCPAAHTIVRTSWLFGTGGTCFPQTILRLAGERDELTVVEDQRGCPTFTGHLAGALIDLARSRSILGLAHVAGSGACSWFEFAQAIVAGAGAQVSVKPCSTEQFPRPAFRPASSVLASERGAPVLPDWRDGLAQYLTESVVR